MGLRVAILRRNPVQLRRLTAIVLGICALLLAQRATAGLEGDVVTLVRAWSSAGRATHLVPQLLERGDVSPLRIDPRLLDPSQPGCVTVALLGTPRTTFALRFLPEAPGGPPPQDEWPESSIAGAAQIVRCGDGKPALTRLAVELRSPRAVLETVVAESPNALPHLRAVLPHRDPGPIVVPVSGGPPPTSIPLKRRAASIEARSRREGAEWTSQRVLNANAEGMGGTVLRFETGCHRVDVLSPAASERLSGAGIDVDVQVASADGGVLASDATESADASVHFCLGQPDTVRVQFIGSLPNVPVVLLLARWALPQGLPMHWPPHARAAAAKAIRGHHDRPLGNALVYESIGVAGVTVLPFEVEPGACYLVALATVRGRSGGLALTAVVGSESLQNQGTPDGDGTTLAFCADNQQRATLEVDARGTGLVWLLGVWQTGRVPIGEVQQ